MPKLWTAIAAAGFLLAAPAFAQSVTFEAADANGDGAVSAEEAKAVMPDLTEEQFTAADADASGTLNADEFAAISG